MKRWQFILPLILLALFFMFSVSRLGDEFRQSAIAPIEFKLRRVLQRDPDLDQRLKIVVYGDRAKRVFGPQEFIPMTLWTEFVSKIASRRPRAILFDKFFSSYFGSAVDAAQFNDVAQRLDFSLVGATAFQALPEFDLQFSSDKFAKWRQLENTAALRYGNAVNLTGPHPDLRPAFGKLGHIHLDSPATLEPARRITEDGSIVPQLGLSFANEVILGRSGLVVDGVRVRLDRHQRIPVNFVERERAHAASLPMASILARGGDGPTLQKIRTGDVVLVLPAMYTGSTDFKESPVGSIEGGFFHASLISSILSGQVLKPVLQVPVQWLFILILLSGLSTWIALALAQRVAVLSLVLGSLILIGIGLFSFVYGRFVWDWHIGSLYYFTNGFILLSIRTIQLERQSERVSSALEGMVAPHILKILRERPEVLLSRPRSLSLTLMFVDIEGFSLRSRGLKPNDVFQILHAQLGLVADIVHRHGGIVDKNLGDGILCYFGYDLREGLAAQAQSAEDAALRAVRCALEIQRNAASVTALCRDPKVAVGSLVPLRIGINSGEVFLGNLGAGRRLDFTIVGEPVNYGKRLEDSCETFRILLGRSTYDLLAKNRGDEALRAVDFRERHLSLKHQNRLEVAWECDPFWDDSTVYLKSLQVVRPNIATTLEHFDTLKKVELPILINEEVNGHILFVSEDELCIRAEQFFCRKVLLRIQLRPEDTKLKTYLDSQRWGEFDALVSWGTPLQDAGFIHGLALVNWPPEKISLLISVLSVRPSATVE